VNSVFYNIENGGGKPTLEAFSSNKVLFQIVETDQATISSEGVIEFNPTLGTETDNGTIMSPASILDHELDHSLAIAKDRGAYEKRKANLRDDGYTNDEEYRVITGSEQETAKANGETIDGKPTRENHKGKSVRVENETSKKKIEDEKK
jgi:hypothetical protein